MPGRGVRNFTTPRDADLGLRRIGNAAGVSVALLPNGAIFAIEHAHDDRRIMINQVLGSPLHGGIGRIVLRIGGAQPMFIEIVGPGADVEVGTGSDRIVWAGEAQGVRYRTTLWLCPSLPAWLWRVELTADVAAAADLLFVQDLGLGERNFLMNNEAYASQYTDHHIAQDAELGPVVMSRQNLKQSGAHPWVAHGCLEGAASFATDALQLFGPAFRDAEGVALRFGTDLPGSRLQHEAACAILQSRSFDLRPGETATRTIFAMFDPDHGEPSSDADLDRIRAARDVFESFRPEPIAVTRPERSLFQDAVPLVAEALTEKEIAAVYPVRMHEEVRDGALLSFFVPDGAQNRHVVLRDKERRVPRRHGTLLRSSQGLLPDDTTLCATAWMHGVFGAQLTIGNTSFHKLFSVSRDPYSITRASGLRILVEHDGAWRLLATPSAFDMGLSDCRWLYRVDGRTIMVHAAVSGAHAAMQWRVTTDGDLCRFLVAGHLVLGEREFDHAGRVTIDPDRTRITLTPDPDSLFGRHYSEAVYHLVSATPGEIEAIGGDELLQDGSGATLGSHIVLRTRPTVAFAFAAVGALADQPLGLAFADAYAEGVDFAEMLAPARRFWSHVTRDVRIESEDAAPADLEAIRTTFPWFAHNAIVHLSVPHGLEQYSGAAWGTRDVCQGPVEFLLSLGHDAPVKDILRIVFAQQSARDGDWPQWFMLEPYSAIRDAHAHGDVIVWPLKALCDYVEATGDLAFLDEPVAWRADDPAQTPSRDPVSVHLDRLIATVQARFIPGTHLICYGEGDWNDSLQPADPGLRDCMVSSWTVALLYQQLRRYAQVQRRAGRAAAAEALEALAGAVAADFQRHLMRDGVVAGYAVFGEGEPELLLHPSDRRTGLRYSLLPMTRSILAGLFTPEQARHHLGLMRTHLLHPDGVRLMDRPVAYHGGREAIFRRAETAAFFGREIGLMYVHAHLRYGEALARLGETEALWDALAVANPIAVTDRLPHAALRQRNAFFSSSDAAFSDRYAASRDFGRVRAGAIAVDGGWRIYSSGPGLYTDLLLRHALGRSGAEIRDERT